MQDISIHLYFVKAVLKHAAKQGYDTERLLQRSRISPRLLEEDQARVSAEQFAKLQSVTMREMGDEMLGYCSDSSKLGQWSALCHWLIQCKTLGQVLKRYCLFYDIMGKNLQPKLSINGDEASLEISPSPNETRTLEPYAYELFAFSLHRQLCWLAQLNLAIEHVYLPYPEPAHSGEYRPMFWGAKTVFNAPCCRIVFRRKLLNTAVKQTPEDLANFLRKPLYSTLTNTYHNKSWSQRVKGVIGDDLSHLPTFANIAATLLVNPKQLRRHLNEEGMSYNELKAQLRRDVAIFYLSKQQTSIEEIAYKTGFSEASSFIRAFKGWTGVTPLTYRKDLL
jgi:AraC-like DNA-binding protein